MDTLVLAIGKPKSSGFNGAKEIHSVQGKILRLSSTSFLEPKLTTVLQKETIDIMRTITSAESKTAYNIRIISEHLTKAGRAINPKDRYS